MEGTDRNSTLSDGWNVSGNEIDTFKKCNYVNGISIEKNADSTWNLLLQIATDDGLDSVTYTSDDEWKTWNCKEK